MCTVIATVLGAVGTLAQAAAARSAAKAQAAAAEQNAKVAEYQAVDAVKRGGSEELKLRRQLAILQGRQRAQAAASGLNPDAGSMEELQRASMEEGASDIALNSENAAREAWGYRVQATNYMNQASAARAQGRNAMIGGILGAGSSLLSLVAPTPTILPPAQKAAAEPTAAAQPVAPVSPAPASGSRSIHIGGEGAVNSPYAGFGDSTLPSGRTLGQAYYEYMNGPSAYSFIGRDYSRLNWNMAG